MMFFHKRECTPKSNSSQRGKSRGMFSCSAITGAIANGVSLKKFIKLYSGRRLGEYVLENLTYIEMRELDTMRSRSAPKLRQRQ